MLVRQLLGVQANPQAMMRRGLEQALRLLGREGDRVAKGIDARRETRLSGFRDQPVDDLADVMRTSVALLRRDCVQCEERRDDAHRFAFPEAIGDAEQAHFALGVEAVAGLDLHRGASA